MEYKNIIERGKRLDGIRYQIWFEEPYFGNFSICGAFAHRSIAESFIDFFVSQHPELDKACFHLIDLMEDGTL